jgi:hypothetical protein
MFFAMARAVGAFSSFGSVGRGLDLFGIGSTRRKGNARLFPIAKETWLASASIFSTFNVVALGVGVAAMVAILALIDISACNNTSSGSFVAIMFFAMARAVGAVGLRLFGGWRRGLDFLGIISARGMGSARFSIAKETWFTSAMKRSISIITICVAIAIVGISCTFVNILTLFSNGGAFGCFCVALVTVAMNPSFSVMASGMWDI